MAFFPFLIRVSAGSLLSLGGDTPGIKIFKDDFQHTDTAFPFTGCSLFSHSLGERDAAVHIHAHEYTKAVMQ